MTPVETEPDLPASVGGPPAEAEGGCGSPWTRKLAAEVLGSTPWHEPSKSLPFVPPKSPGTLKCWVASGQTTNREGTQTHPSVVKWIKVLLSSEHQSNNQLYPPTDPTIRKLAQAS